MLGVVKPEMPPSKTRDTMWECDLQRRPLSDQRCMEREEHDPRSLPWEIKFYYVAEHRKTLIFIILALWQALSNEL